MDNFLRNTGGHGGLMGALLGALVSVKTYRPADKPITKVGKTAAISGLGYLLGSWIARKIAK